MEGVKKIDEEEISNVNKMSDNDISLFFGDWVNNIQNLKREYLINSPFPYIIIDNFLNSNFVNNIKNEFPDNLNDFFCYFNPIHYKFGNDNINCFPENLKKSFYLLSSEFIIKKFSDMTDIKLEYDPYLHGAGIHAMPRNGKLSMHLDYEKHPYLEKQRRLNVILYLNDEWNDSWGGATELWDSEMNSCVKKSPIKFNTAIVFRTDEISWHGIPEKIKCPPNILRKTLAYYYISDVESEKTSSKIGNDGSGYRTRATFVKRPEDPEDKRMDELFSICPFRRINNDDMNRIWPDWTPENEFF